MNLAPVNMFKQNASGNPLVCLCKKNLECCALEICLTCHEFAESSNTDHNLQNHHGEMWLLGVHWIDETCSVFALDLRW